MVDFIRRNMRDKPINKTKKSNQLPNYFKKLGQIGPPMKPPKKQKVKKQKVNKFNW